jgi:hypothetical protein
MSTGSMAAIVAAVALTVFAAKDGQPPQLGDAAWLNDSVRVTDLLPPGHPPVPGRGLPEGHPPIGESRPGLPEGHPPIPWASPGCRRGAAQPYEGFGGGGKSHPAEPETITT